MILSLCKLIVPKEFVEIVEFFAEIVSKKLLFRNHVEVLYDVAGIPAPVIT